MTASNASKPLPARVLVFGASGHLGGPLASWLQWAHPDIGLRLVTSRAEKVDALRARFPHAQIVVADLLDVDSLRPALRGVDAAFLVTPDFFDEERGMRNFAAAASGTRLIHVVRLVGDIPGMTLERMPAEMFAMGEGPAVQHLKAKAILREAGLPLTIMNSCYFMDDFITHFLEPIRTAGVLIVPFERRMTFIDTAELGEIAARLIVSPNARHIGQEYAINNGADCLLFSEVAALLSEVLQVRIRHDPSPERFLEVYGPILERITGTDRATSYFLLNWRIERDHDVTFIPNAFAGSILGRPPKRLRAFFEQNRSLLLPLTS